MKPYFTALKAAQVEHTIERSRFIGHICPVKTPEECEGFFHLIRKAHRQATHNVPAYVLGEGAGIQWAGDDGEPRGTSGAPIVHMLVNEGISDVAVMVTRYFGGIKLGTGGLVRAYTGVAKLVLAEAGLGRVSERFVMDVEMDYSDYNRLEMTADGTFTIENAVFEEHVMISLVCDPDCKDAIIRRLFIISPGARIVSERMTVTTTPLEDTIDERAK